MLNKHIIMNNRFVLDFQMSLLKILCILYGNIVFFGQKTYDLYKTNINERGMNNEKESWL